MSNIFGNFEETITDEELKVINEYKKIYEAEGIDAMVEYVVHKAIELRPDVDKEELLEIIDLYYEHKNNK